MEFRDVALPDQERKEMKWLSIETLAAVGRHLLAIAVVLGSLAGFLGGALLGALCAVGVSEVCVGLVANLVS